jgi:hypothetical protein
MCFDVISRFLNMRVHVLEPLINRIMLSVLRGIETPVPRMQRLTRVRFDMKTSLDLLHPSRLWHTPGPQEKNSHGSRNRLPTWFPTDVLGAKRSPTVQRPLPARKFFPRSLSTVIHSLHQHCFLLVTPWHTARSSIAHRRKHPQFCLVAPSRHTTRSSTAHRWEHP